MRRSRLVPALLAGALLGVVGCVGLVVGALLGTVAAVVYTVLALVLLGLAARRGTRLLAASRAAQGRSCTCCTTSQHDPVEIR